MILETASRVLEPSVRCEPDKRGENISGVILSCISYRAHKFGDLKTSAVIFTLCSLLVISAY